MRRVHLIDVRPREDVNRTPQGAVRIERIDDMARGEVHANDRLGKRAGGQRREAGDQGRPPSWIRVVIHRTPLAWADQIYVPLAPGEASRKSQRRSFAPAALRKTYRGARLRKRR